MENRQTISSTNSYRSWWWPKTTIALGVVVLGVGYYYYNNYKSLAGPQTQLFPPDPAGAAVNSLAGRVTTTPDQEKRVIHERLMSDTTEFLIRCQQKNVVNEECTNSVEWFSKSNQRPIETALETLKQCPEADLAWQKINQFQRICKVLVPSSIVPTGRALFEINTILIGNDQSEEAKLYWLLFEMQNFIHRGKTERLFEEAMKGNVAREQFTRQVEQNEFEAAISNYELNQHCIKNSFWKLEKPESFLLDKISKQIGFEKFWSYARLSSHAENMRSQWDQIIKPVYCEKNPNGKDCLS